MRREALLEALLCNAPSLSRTLSRDHPMILCRFPQISAEDQGDGSVISFPRPRRVRGNGRVRRKKQAAFQHSVLCDSHLKGLNNVLASN